jgi:hypothetical protein
VAKRKSKKKVEGNAPDDLIGVDEELGLYELTDLFHAYYKYHNEDCLISYDEVVTVNPLKREIKTSPKNLSRFQALRRIEACTLGSRPFATNEVAAHRPNVSFGYLSQLLRYTTLPYRSIFTDSDIAKIRINKRLLDIETLSDTELEEQKLQAANNPNITNNKEVGDDISDAFTDLLKVSERFQECQEQVSKRVRLDGAMAFLHSDVDWAPEPVWLLDLVTEPQAKWKTSTWNSFFVIRKLTAAEAAQHIREKTKFWDTNALRWALESATDNRSVLNYSNYGIYSDGEDSGVANGENFMIRSYYSEKASRLSNIGSYYGNMLVVEGYYTNTEGKINKVIFFPSQEFVNVSQEERSLRTKALLEGDETAAGFKDADILFFRKNVFDSMEEAITVVPFNRAEPSLERQRADGHELFPIVESIGRLDSSILNLATLMGIPYLKNRLQGTDAQDSLDLEINVNGEMVDLGDRDFVSLPFSADLGGMMSVRGQLIQHLMGKCFLGGLDGNDTMANGRGQGMANLRLVRDGRVYKVDVEDFSRGLKDVLTRMFRRILDLKKKKLTSSNVLLQKRFFDVVTQVHGHDERILEFKASDIVPDTGLPYWMSLEVIRNGGSHFGAAEMILYSEIKQIFGDGLDQRSLQALNRMGIKSLLGQEDAIDILGDPKDEVIVEQDQIYRAAMENAALLGAIDQGSVNFEPIPVLADKDDHVSHLTQVHNPKAQELIQMLQEGDVTPDMIQELTEEQLNTRTNLILKLGSLSNHISLHAQMLERFGSKRDDINRLKEETNAILQSAEGLLYSLQINMRALQQKREEKEMRLLNLSPENEAEKMKQENELAKLQAANKANEQKIILANKIADQKQQQHIDKQVSKARDRNLKKELAMRDIEFKSQDVRIKNKDVEGKNFERQAKAQQQSFGRSSGE